MSAGTPTRPSPTRRPDAPSAPESSDEQRRPRFFGLSMTQLLATAFAAVTATVAGSFLGVSGTVIGAAVASVVSAVGNAVYSASLRRTQERVRAVVPVVVPASGRWAQRSVRHTPPGSASAGGAPTRPAGRSAGARRPSPRPVAGSDRPPTLPAPGPKDDRPARRAVPWKGIALASIGAFAAVLAAVTVVEVAAGRPLTDLLRGHSGSGTSLFGGTGGSGHTKTDTPSPAPTTVTTTVIPKVVVTTPTVTRTAPARTTTAPAPTTGTSTSSGSATTSGAPSAPASASASPGEDQSTLG